MKVIHFNRRRSTALVLGLFFAGALLPRSAPAEEPLAGRPLSGQEKVDEFFGSHKALLSPDHLPSSEQERAAHRDLDALCGQKDCYSSRLFWHRDLESAKAEAKRLNRPILGLAMLGNLTEELSCANSRYFRAILYSNPKIAGYLRDHYVIYWQSVRPVPQVTIDFGDGRKLRQTITGNSIHYFLASDGTVIDALPGLYKPAAFLGELERFAKEAPWKNPQPEAVTDYENKRITAMMAVSTINSVSRFNALQLRRASDRKNEGAAPPALLAERYSTSKMAFETRVLRGMDTPRSFEELQTLRAELRELVPPLEPEQVLAPESLRYIRVHSPKLEKSAMDDFLRSIEADTRLNEGEQRLLLLGWLVRDPSLRAIVPLNVKVYDELFKTPDGDRWLGLDPNAVYSGITFGGAAEESI